METPTMVRAGAGEGLTTLQSSECNENYLPFLSDTAPKSNQDQKTQSSL